jgi:hypothetical protein
VGPVPDYAPYVLTFEISLNTSELLEPTRFTATVDAIRFDRFAIGGNFFRTC